MRAELESRGGVDVVPEPGLDRPPDAGPVGDHEAGFWSGGWRRFALSCGMLVYPLVTATGIAEYSSGRTAVVGYVVVVLFSVCYLIGTLTPYGGGSLRFWAMVALMTVLFVGALPSAHGHAFFLLAVVLSVITVPLQRRAIPLVVLGTVAAVVVPMVVPGVSSDPGWVQALAILCTVLMVFAFSETVRSNQALVEARAKIARVASEAERARIARDLHDLLGHSLSAITVKSSLACRLAAESSDKALQEIADVEKLARQSLADVRAAVSGYREVTLASELARGRELLRASGVTADLPNATDVVDVTYQELFGWVLREGLTNVVRHARAARCTVTLSESAIEVLDDGYGVVVEADGRGTGREPGNGLDGLRERVALAGGQVESGPARPRGWLLKVWFERPAAVTS